VTRRRFSVHLTANFEADLDQIRQFLQPESSSPPITPYQRLLDQLLEVVTPNLESYPAVGRLFADRTAASLEGQHRLVILREQARGMEIREYLFGEYLLLYAVTERAVYLLSIRHHRQLSFDLEAFWPPTP